MYVVDLGGRSTLEVKGMLGQQPETKSLSAKGSFFF